jgi:hypothetical protein
MFNYTFLDGTKIYIIKKSNTQSIKSKLKNTVAPKVLERDQYTKYTKRTPKWRQKHDYKQINIIGSKKGASN